MPLPSSNAQAPWGHEGHVTAPTIGKIQPDFYPGTADQSWPCWCWISPSKTPTTPTPRRVFFFFFFFSRPDPATEQSRQGRPVTGQFPRNSASVSVWSVSESTAPTRRNARPPPWPSRPASDWRFGVINPMISCPPRPFSSGCSERRWILHGEQTRLRAVSALFQRNPPIPGGCRWGRGFG